VRRAGVRTVLAVCLALPRRWHRCLARTPAHRRATGATTRGRLL